MLLWEFGGMGMGINIAASASCSVVKPDIFYLNVGKCLQRKVFNLNDNLVQQSVNREMIYRAGKKYETIQVSLPRFILF